MEIRKISFSESQDIIDPIILEMATCVVALIKAYHAGECGDGDSYVLFNDKALFYIVKNILADEKVFNWSHENLDLMDEDCGVLFTNRSNDNCILTTSKDVYDSAPRWVGLKIFI